MALVAFQPEGEVWFHRKNTSGKTHIAIDSTLRDELRSGSLPSSTQVCKSGEDKFIEAVDHPSFSGLFPEHASPALPPPLPPAPTPPHLPVGSKNPIIATLLAILFGPLGLLYLSWKVSAVTFLLHIVCSAIFGWSNWAGILFWHILPTAIAYWISRKVNNLSQFLGLIRSDAVLAFSLLKKIFLTRLGYWSSTIIFATGFIFSGSFVTKKWITELDWLAILFYSILLLYTTRISFNLSKRYIFSIKTSTTVYFSYPVITDSEILRKYLQWSAFCLLTFVTFILWKDNPGIVRLLLIAGAISIPFLNFMRGAVGAFGLGCLGGWVALIAKSIIESIYLFIMK
jgi:hypothetical protein